MAADDPRTDAAAWTPRVFGQHEAAAIFDDLQGPGTVVAELQAERELLLACRTALSGLLRAVGSENFNRPARAPEMSAGLRVAIRNAKEALADA